MTSSTIGPIDRFYRIIEDRMCVGCRICQAVAGRHRTQMKKAANRYERMRQRQGTGSVLAKYRNHALLDPPRLIANQ